MMMIVVLVVVGFHNYGDASLLSIPSPVCSCCCSFSPNQKQHQHHHPGTFLFLFLTRDCQDYQVWGLGTLFLKDFRMKRSRFGTWLNTVD